MRIGAAIARSAVFIVFALLGVAVTACPPPDRPDINPGDDDDSGTPMDDDDSAR